MSERGDEAADQAGGRSWRGSGGGVSDRGCASGLGGPVTAGGLI